MKIYGIACFICSRPLPKCTFAMSLSQKRKRVSLTSKSPAWNNNLSAVNNAGSDPAPFIQAHEADIVHEPQAIPTTRFASGSGDTEDGLVQWGEGTAVVQKGKESRITIHDDDDDDVNENEIGDQVSQDLWIDRYASFLAWAVYISTIFSPIPPLH